MTFKMTRLRVVAALLALIHSDISFGQNANYPPKINLVLVIVVDQLRSDNLTRYQSRFVAIGRKGKSKAGFRELMSRGAYYPFAQYDILQPMTGPGHATVLSGSYPYLNGIPTNSWYDSASGRDVYCVEDEKSAIVGPSSERARPGVSPRLFLGSTVGDELKNGGWSSRVLSVALKDRAAVLLGGRRADLALWMDGATQRWVSSEYYLPQKRLPEWVNQLNSELGARSGQKVTWAPGKGEADQADEQSRYISERTKKESAGGFPHSLVRGTMSELSSPLGLELTVDAAERAMRSEKLGSGRAADLLAVSFSSHDYVGHSFGPNSKENEEMVVAMDKALARLLTVVEQTVPGGLKSTLVVLTADHGVAPIAGWLKDKGFDAGAIDMKDLQARMEEHLAKRFGRGDSLIARTLDFGFWLNRRAIESRKLKLSEVSEELKEGLLLEPGFAFAFTSADVKDRSLPPGFHGRRALRTYIKSRSADVIGIVRPYFYAKEHTTTHMADYSYDESVPLLLMGPGIRPGVYAEEAQVVDIAPTLSFLLGSLAPVLSEGRVLRESIALRN